MNNKLYIVGIGPGDKELIYRAALEIIEQCDVLIGGTRNLELFSELDKEKLAIGNNLEEIYSYIDKNIGMKKITVLVTGDPGVYSIMEFLKTRLKDVEIEVLPGISSLQYLCSRIKLNWNDMYITSLHGREQDDLKAIVKSHRKIAIFTGGRCTPADVCKRFIQDGLNGIAVTVGENLSYPNERIKTGTPEEISEMSFESLSIMIVEQTREQKQVQGVWDYTTHGIPDDLFIRGNVPMTKEEIRAVSLSKLRLWDDSIVYDIGAGTGSVSIECALRCSNGKVFAVDKDNEAVELISRNIQKFNVHNIEIIEAEAPYLAEKLPEPDRVFVGGSCGNMDEILDWISDTARSIRVVINTVTIESTYEAIKGLTDKGFENIEITCISAARSKAAGGKHLMQSMNPVYVICGDKGGC